MKKWVKGIAILILTPALLAAALWTWSRLRGPTEEQRRALALMTEYQEPAGRNAFAAIWTLPYVPKEEAAMQGEYWEIPLPPYLWEGAETE